MDASNSKSQTFTGLLLAHWRDIALLKSNPGNGVRVDGHSLTVADVLAVARHLQPVEMTEDAIKTIKKCSGIIDEYLEQGKVIYGVNTGFGGSADTRTNDVRGLQKALLTSLHCGLIAQDEGHLSTRTSHHASPGFATTLPLDTPATTSRMVDSWVRASMVVRLNSFAVGASGIRETIAQTTAELLNKDILPCIPLRGSISASGDLSPLSYIGGLLVGSSAIAATVGDHRTGRERVPADVALKKAGITPIELQAKEGLAIVNGTSVSAGVAALALHEALNLAGLSQILTSMTVEALRGHRESFDPFIAKVRPHVGQVDSARSIFAFMADSRLTASNAHDEGDHELAQDRYSVRTASQWIGPVLEDMALAHAQISVELNSATDNPLIDAEKKRILHGGNFQAKSVTVAVEKLRQGLQSLGRMMFAQCGELINPMLNRGLPPNLAVDEPSESFLFKPTDILMAAMTSELGFLANPVGSHVQTAEMGNQAINSLALISTRYTMDAIDIFSQMAAVHLVVACHALDLRVMHMRFLDQCRPLFAARFAEFFSSPSGDMSVMDATRNASFAKFAETLSETTTYDSEARMQNAVESMESVIVKALASSPSSFSVSATKAAVGTKEAELGLSMKAVQGYASAVGRLALQLFRDNRDRYRRSPDASPYLGRAARRMYHFVRHELKVPLFGEGEVWPRAATETGEANSDQPGTFLSGMTPSVGSYSTAVYQAIRNGSLYSVVADCMAEAETAAEGANTSTFAGTFRSKL